MKAVSVFLLLFCSIATYAQDSEEIYSSEQVEEISILGGCGGSTCFVGERIPQKCEDVGCLKCTSIDGGIRGKCTRD